ncbi:hypothetical protein [Alkaliphilus serpentinus]|uniref:Uncharacterized protein n=1 Tax=Alkaliphilus serpentinus TaxID=1482731 RepID=A0A833M7N9_9FIRM|nr:hypothetical protein [Alkaliphilus serpentinus]KAB3529027.1 hypothetical protein F8153_10240 [Alkaliphilus serpentinus]
MDEAKLNELIKAAKAGDYSKLEEVKDLISEEDYQKVLNLFQQYKGKSEGEILKELSRLQGNIPNKEAIIQQIQPFLTDDQKVKLQKIMEYLNQQE